MASPIDESVPRDCMLLSESPAWLSCQLQDGTNVSPETEFIISSPKSGGGSRCIQFQESSTWEDRTQRLLDEFRQFRQVGLPVGAVLTESRTPRFGINDVPVVLTEPSKLLKMSSAHLLDPSQLFDRKTREPLLGLFPFLDRHGNPLLNSLRRPLGYRLGFVRSYNLVQLPRSVHDKRELLIARLFELCREAGLLLTQLPAACRLSLWHRWRNVRTFPNSSEYSWIDSLFEYGWSHQPSCGRYVYTQGGYLSMCLDGDGLFPRIPACFVGETNLTHRFPSEAGYPYRWASEIDDVTSTSINFLEWIITKSEWVEASSSVDQKSPNPEPFRPSETKANPNAANETTARQTTNQNGTTRPRDDAPDEDELEAARIACRKNPKITRDELRDQLKVSAATASKLLEIMRNESLATSRSRRKPRTD